MIVDYRYRLIEWMIKQLVDWLLMGLTSFDTE
jgi:hypothetical protein